MAVLRGDTTIGGVSARDASLFNSGVLADARLPNKASVSMTIPQGSGNTGYACGYVAYNMNYLDNISFSTTFTARSAGTLTYVLFCNTESPDRLSVTAAGSTVNNSGGTWATSHSSTLTSGQTIVLTYIKDASLTKGNDVCGIANMMWTPSGSSYSYPIYGGNIGSYFNISNSTGSYYFRYSFVVFTPSLYTDNQGRVTSSTYYPQVLPM